MIAPVPHRASSADGRALTIVSDEAALVMAMSSEDDAFAMFNALLEGGPLGP